MLFLSFGIFKLGFFYLLYQDSLSGDRILSGDFRHLKRGASDNTLGISGVILRGVRFHIILVDEPAFGRSISYRFILF